MAGVGAAAAAGPTARPAILVVDDIALNRKLASTILKKLGFAVLEAADGIEACDIYQSSPASILAIFLDLNMPLMDGWQTARWLRMTEDTASKEEEELLLGEGAEAAGAGAGGVRRVGATKEEEATGACASVGFRASDVSSSATSSASQSSASSSSSQDCEPPPHGPSPTSSIPDDATPPSPLGHSSSPPTAAGRQKRAARMPVIVCTANELQGAMPWVQQSHPSGPYATATTAAHFPPSRSCSLGALSFSKCVNNGGGGGRGRASGLRCPAASGDLLGGGICSCEEPTTITESALHAGADEVLSKPLRLSTVEVVLDRHLPLWRDLVRAAAAVLPAAAAVAAAPRAPFPGLIFPVVPDALPIGALPAFHLPSEVLPCTAGTTAAASAAATAAVASAPASRCPSFSGGAAGQVAAFEAAAVAAGRTVTLDPAAAICGLPSNPSTRTLSHLLLQRAASTSIPSHPPSDVDVLDGCTLAGSGGPHWRTTPSGREGEAREGGERKGEGDGGDGEGMMCIDEAVEAALAISTNAAVCCLLARTITPTVLPTPSSSSSSSSLLRPFGGGHPGRDNKGAAAEGVRSSLEQGTSAFSPRRFARRSVVSFAQGGGEGSGAVRGISDVGNYDAAENDKEDDDEDDEEEDEEEEDGEGPYSRLPIASAMGGGALSWLMESDAVSSTSSNVQPSTMAASLLHIVAAVTPCTLPSERASPSQRQRYSSHHFPTSTLDWCSLRSAVPPKPTSGAGGSHSATPLPVVSPSLSAGGLTRGGVSANSHGSGSLW